MSSSVTRGCRLFTVIFVPSKGLNASCQHKQMHHIKKVRNAAGNTAQQRKHEEEVTKGMSGNFCTHTQRSELQLVMGSASMLTKAQIIWWWRGAPFPCQFASEVTFFFHSHNLHTRTGLCGHACIFKRTFLLHSVPASKPQNMASAPQERAGNTWWVTCTTHQAVWQSNSRQVVYKLPKRPCVYSKKLYLEELCFSPC